MRRTATARYLTACHTLYMIAIHLNDLRTTRPPFGAKSAIVALVSGIPHVGFRYVGVMRFFVRALQQ